MKPAPPPLSPPAPLRAAGPHLLASTPLFSPTGTPHHNQLAYIADDGAPSRSAAIPRALPVVQMSLQITINKILNKQVDGRRRGLGKFENGMDCRESQARLSLPY